MNNEPLPLSTHILEKSFHSSFHKGINLDIDGQNDMQNNYKKINSSHKKMQETQSISNKNNIDSSK